MNFVERTLEKVRTIILTRNDYYHNSWIISASSDPSAQILSFFSQCIAAFSALQLDPCFPKSVVEVTMSRIDTDGKLKIASILASVFRHMMQPAICLVNKEGPRTLQIW